MKIPVAHFRNPENSEVW